MISFLLKQKILMYETDVIISVATTGMRRSNG